MQNASNNYYRLPNSSLCLFCYVLVYCVHKHHRLPNKQSTEWLCASWSVSCQHVGNSTYPITLRKDDSILVNENSSAHQPKLSIVSAPRSCNCVDVVIDNSPTNHWSWLNCTENVAEDCCDLVLGYCVGLLVCMFRGWEGPFYPSLLHGGLSSFLYLGQGAV